MAIFHASLNCSFHSLIKEVTDVVFKINKYKNIRKITLFPGSDKSR